MPTRSRSARRCAGAASCEAGPSGATCVAEVVKDALALVAAAVLVAAIVLLRWYSLDDYDPSGWEASFWLRAALVLTIIAALALRFRVIGPRAFAGAALVVLAMVAFRVALPPDFGFDFDGLDVPVERGPGAWVGLGAAAVLALAAVRETRGLNGESSGTPASP